MAVNAGPNIVNDGLTVLFDVGNPVSYPGSGNTIFNLVKNNNMTGTTVSTAVDATAGRVLNHNSSSALSCTFSSSINHEEWSMLYWIRSTGLTSSNYRQVIRLVEPNATHGYFYTVDTRETTNSRILGYQKHFTINDWFALQHMTATSWDDETWWGLGVTHNNTVFKHYNNGILINTATQTRDVAGYGDLTSLSVNTSGSNTVYMGPIMLYNRILSNAEMKQNFDAYRGRFGL